jgi:hypothetical protein
LATAAASSRVVPALPGRRYDKFFFSSMAFVMLALVLIGFGRSYFLAGMIRAHLPSPIIHVHGAVFTTWIILLIVQTSLVASGNVAIHRKLGLWAFGLACLMVPLGVAAATNSLSRNFTVPGLDALTFYAIPILGLMTFAVLLLMGYRNRLNSAAHKRLVLLATISLMGAPTGRPPFTVITAHPHFSGFFLWLLIVLMMSYDLWTLHKIHPATLWGGLAVIVVDQISVPIGMTPAWHHLASAIQAMVQH